MTLLAVCPHPDDESTSTGGMLAYYSARDVRTGVVICTGGEEGEIHDADLDPVANRSRLREIRTQEVKDACAILGVAELRMLGYRDSGMAGTPANQHPEAFVNAERVEAAGKLVRIIRELRPSVIVTEPPGVMYPHPDHVMCHEISVDAFQAAVKTISEGLEVLTGYPAGELQVDGTYPEGAVNYLVARRLLELNQSMRGYYGEVLARVK